MSSSTIDLGPPIPRSPARGRALHAGFLRSAARFPERLALEVDGERLTYRELRARAGALAATTGLHDRRDGPPLTALLAARSVTAFAGVLGALLAGHGYVPLNPRFPIARNRAMLARSGARTLVVDRDSLELLDELLATIESPLVVIAPDADGVDRLAARWPRHTVLGAGDLVRDDSPSPAPEVDRDALAYLLFTSGSTGTPKGVAVAQRNVVRFVELMSWRYAVGPEDRLSQMFDLTFDLSAFDMFVAWENGACLCCPAEHALLSPRRLIRDAELSVFFCVPSTGVFMRRLGMLKPGAYPALRLVLACGEPLPVSVAQAFAAAAPNAIVENLYGPTELTIACTLHRFDAARAAGEPAGAVVPIGKPFNGMRALVADDVLREVAPGESGELLMSGPQVTLGYWNDPERTAAAFVVPPGRAEIHYRTGDRVRRPRPGEPIVYLGRVDQQVKVLGHRVELGEVEAALRDAAGVDSVAVIAWPRTASGADGLVGFVAAPGLDAAATLARLRARLPDYMVPRRLELEDDLPLNANGKIDRGALLARLQSS